MTTTRECISDGPYLVVHWRTSHKVHRACFLKISKRLRHDFLIDIDNITMDAARKIAR